MNNYQERKCIPRSRERLWIKLGGLAVVMVIAAMSLRPCRGQTPVSDLEESDMAPADLLRILGEKEVAIKHADQEYAKMVGAADTQYEQALLNAKILWSKKTADAKVEAVHHLKALSSQLATAGQLGQMVKVLEAVYALTREDPEVVQALVAAGVDLNTISPQMDYFARREGKPASRIVLWNTHNSRFNTSGTLQCNVVLFQGCTPVWRMDKVNLPWDRNNDTFTVVHVPGLDFDIVRVEIIKWQGYSGGLTEIEVWQEGKNIALHRPTRASGAVDRQTISATVTDGVTTSVSYKKGYWLLPDNQAGWIEISLFRPVYQRVHQARVLARKPWQRVLEVSEGDMVDITANGTWWASPRILAGPDGGLGPGGDQSGRYSDRFYLQGRLNGDVFKIGSQFTLNVPKDGTLELGMNEEEIAWFANNSSFIDVTLRIRQDSPLPEEDIKTNASPVSQASLSGQGVADKR